MRAARDCGATLGAAASRDHHATPSASAPTDTYPSRPSRPPRKAKAAHVPVASYPDRGSERFWDGLSSRHLPRISCVSPAYELVVLRVNGAAPRCPPPSPVDPLAPLASAKTALREVLPQHDFVHAVQDVLHILRVLQHAGSRGARELIGRTGAGKREGGSREGGA